eukprot:7353330-Alexandrium_andersonii.AAC.1
MVGAGGTAFAVYNIYGWPGGATSPATARRTAHLLTACLVETAAQGDIHALVLGDFNLDFGSSPAAADFRAAGWVDV